MKFLIITKYDSYIIEAETWAGAVNETYNTQTGWSDVLSISVIPEE